MLIYIGWCLNITAFIIHVLWCDKDPSHEDTVINLAILFCFVPFMVFGIVSWELISQKVFNYHHGVKRK